jgi:hypothetical protein
MFLNNLNYSPSVRFLSPNTGYTGFTFTGVTFLLKLLLSQVAAPTKQDAIEWAEIIKETAESASHREEENRKKERAMRIARELSNLVVYCQSVVFNNERSDFYCHCLYLPIFFALCKKDFVNVKFLLW